MISPAQMLGKVMLGNAAGWLLTFHREGPDGAVVENPAQDLEIGSDDYYAEIHATLPGGLEGGSYSFIIEGITDEHYGRISQSPDDHPKVVRLYLFWRDANASFAGYAANLAGLTDTLGGAKSESLRDFRVAELAIVSVTRKAGARRYEVTIEARERVFERASRRRITALIPASANAKDMAESLATNHNLPVEAHPFTPTGEGPALQPLEAGQTVLAALASLGIAMECASNKYGRGMYLIRNGTLHIGERLFPLEGEPQPLTFENGLLETELLAPFVTDPNFFDREDAEATSPTRRQFKLTLKGRPDIRPGDVVVFGAPPEDADTTPSVFGAIVGALSGPILPSLGGGAIEHPVNLYVSGVEHRLGRTAGFLTTATGVELEDLASPWDAHTGLHRSEGACSPSGSSAPEARASDALDRRIATALNGHRHPETGEVRAMTTTSGDVPSQTLLVWRGLAPPDGRPNRANRLAIQRPSPAPAPDIPYASAFAWGKCGLVLPRYPGTRVLVAHRDGAFDDPIDLGAVWEAGRGPDSEPGDWWLILPVGVASSSRATIADSATPEEHTGKVTNDLIDADGNRMIEVGEITIRVGRDSLRNAGERPTPPDDRDSVTIEHTDGDARIVMKSDGSVTITAKSIELDAGSGDITLKANNVNVQVQGSMDVS
jgi:hypothetical protein